MYFYQNIYFILKIFPDKKIPSLDTLSHVMYLNREGGGGYVYILL
jgi:hypothetical protein